jgi:hypothetical protein
MPQGNSSFLARSQKKMESLLPNNLRPVRCFFCLSHNYLKFQPAHPKIGRSIESKTPTLDDPTLAAGIPRPPMVSIVKIKPCQSKIYGIVGAKHNLR